MQILDCEQRTPEWYRARLGIPTTSEFHRFVRPSDGKLRANKSGQLSQGAMSYIDDLIAERFMGLAAHPDSSDAFWLAHGRETEDRARAAFELETELNTDDIGIVLNKGAGASPDFRVAGGVVTPAELKCPKASTHVGYLREPDQVPATYLPQVHGHMVVCEADRAFWQSYCPPMPDVVICVERDEYTDNVAEALTLFMKHLHYWCLKLDAPAVGDIPWTD